jgi:Histidine kinase-, DNA gyrase B-, and HSP90-like ATPase
MSDSRMRLLLFLAIFIACAVPIAAAFYLVDDALQRSLNLGFNPQIMRSLDNGAKNLKTLKNIDAAHEPEYRAEFDDIQDLMRVYARPQWVKSSVLGSLKIYFGCGLVAAVIVSLSVATLLGRRISRSYQIAINELLAHRERVRYLEEMSSWQELAKTLAHEIKNPLTPIEVLITSLAHLPAVLAHFVSARIAMNADPADDVRARMDTALFRPVLMNIIGNGVEANPGRDVAFTIEVTATKSSIDVSISNDGEAVAAQMAPHIFDPYISSHGGRDNMGLGLAIVKKIVVEHAGDITYTETAGHPRFRISLPRVG